MYAFKKQGIKFDYRPSAKTFFDSNQKIDKEAVKAGDFMDADGNKIGKAGV